MIFYFVSLVNKITPVINKKCVQLEQNVHISVKCLVNFIIFYS